MVCVQSILPADIADEGSAITSLEAVVRPSFQNGPDSRLPRKPWTIISGITHKYIKRTLPHLPTDIAWSVQFINSKIAKVKNPIKCGKSL